MDPTIFPADRVTIVGVLNLTPDSFSDGGRFVRSEGAAERVDVDAAVAAGAALARAGADWIDVGGESTRPGAAPVSEARELARTREVVEALAKSVAVPISIDTRHAAVAEAALAAGAQAVNDVSGGRHDPDLLRVAARTGAGLVLGHLRGEPATMQRDVRFGDVLAEVGDELAAAVERAQAAGVARARIAVDPGIGFGKETAHNLVLLANVGALAARLGLPVLVGPSRKAFLGQLTGDPPAARDAATVAACAVAVFTGAAALRVHDVPGAMRAAAIGLALRGARRAPHGEAR
jgi:dihydropteroate synthase